MWFDFFSLLPDSIIYLFEMLEFFPVLRIISLKLTMIPDFRLFFNT